MHEIINAIMDDKISLSILYKYNINEMNKNEKDIYYLILEILTSKYHLKNSCLNFPINRVLRLRIEFCTTKLNEMIKCL